jgi:hypothetical protein
MEMYFTAELKGGYGIKEVISYEGDISCINGHIGAASNGYSYIGLG